MSAAVVVIVAAVVVRVIIRGRLVVSVSFVTIRFWGVGVAT